MAGLSHLVSNPSLQWVRQVRSRPVSRRTPHTPDASTPGAEGSLKYTNCLQEGRGRASPFQVLSRRRNFSRRARRRASSDRLR